MEKIQLGARGERLVEKFLRKKGYKVLEKNYRSRFGEIDIIVKKGSEIVFVEVKTRSSKEFGEPENAITKIKLDHFSKTAQSYIQKNNITQCSVRLDAVSVFIVPEKNDFEIEHFENINS